MKWAILAAIRAAISSNCGNVRFFRGATRDFVITNEVWGPCWRNATVPNASVLASANTCSCNSACCSTGVGRYCLGRVACFVMDCWISSAMVNHLCCRS